MSCPLQTSRTVMRIRGMSGGITAISHPLSVRIRRVDAGHWLLATAACFCDHYANLTKRSCLGLDHWTSTLQVRILPHPPCATLGGRWWLRFAHEYQCLVCRLRFLSTLLRCLFPTCNNNIMTAGMVRTLMWHTWSGGRKST
jgi:hypothetical protein